MRKFYSFVLMACALLLCTNAWATVWPVADEAAFDTAWVKAAASGDVIKLTDGLTLTKTLWLGTDSLQPDSRSIEIDLNGNELRSSASYAFVLTHGKLTVNTSKADGKIIGEGKCQLFTMAGSTNKDVDPSVDGANYFTYLNIGEGVTLTQSKYSAVINIDEISSNHSQYYSMNDDYLPKKPQLKYLTNVYAEKPKGYNKGVAHGVRIDFHGIIIGTKYGIQTVGYLGTKSHYVRHMNKDNDGNYTIAESFVHVVNGDSVPGRSSLAESGVKAYYEQTDAPDNIKSYKIKESDTKYAPFIHIYPEARITVWPADTSTTNPKSPIGVYAAGYARWKIEGYVEGCNGAVVKSGEVDFHDATIAATGTSYAAPNASTSGTLASGSAIVLDSGDSYNGDIDVTVSGDSHISATNGYAIDEKVTAANQTTKVEAISITGGTFIGGTVHTIPGDETSPTMQGVMNISEPTALAAANPDTVTTITIIGATIKNDENNKVQIGNNNLAEFLEGAAASQGSTHITYVDVPDPSNPGQTISTLIISQGTPPETDPNETYTAWQYIKDNQGSNKSFAWTKVPESAEIAANDTVTLEELQINSGNATDGLQQLTINNGAVLQVERLIMNPYARIVVKAGGKLIVTGTQGISAPVVENIELESSESAQAIFLFNPTVSSNKHPNATVDMYVACGKDAYDENVWNRFAMPVQTLAAFSKKYNYPAWLYGWDYEANEGQGEWALVPGGSAGMKPWTGYTLSYNETGEQVFTFKGDLAGNDNAPVKFVHRGFNYFGNTYTGHMDCKKLLEGLQDAHIDGTVYVWNGNAADPQYSAVTLNRINDTEHPLEDWEKDVKSMETFILQLRGVNSANESVSYKKTVWENPRHGYVAPAQGDAPRRTLAVAENDAYIQMVVTSANGKSDRIILMESEDYTDAFESGYDATKFFNAGRLNIYSSIEGENFSDVATNVLEGKTIAMQTEDAVNYTISFKNVDGNEYALRDNVTNKVIAIVEGATYEFAAQPNSVIEGRFEIVPVAKVSTAIENTEVNANVKGIYTITGQFVGDNFEILPAGIYVVDGVKIVK